MFIIGSLLFFVAFSVLPLTLLLVGASISDVFYTINYGITGSMIFGTLFGFILDKIKK